MKKFVLSLCITFSIVAQSDEWVTILIHGTVGFQANASLKTISQIKKDQIEGSEYERNVLAIREHSFLFALQPMQKLGLHPVKKTKGFLEAAYAFSVLYEEVQQLCGIKEKNRFYTFGWTGLISKKRRYCEARLLYTELRKLGRSKKKIRIIGYSHGATLLLQLADVREQEFPEDTFSLDEIFLVGLPVQSQATEQIYSPLFKKIYNIYSRGDKVQRLDIFTSDTFLTHRTFKGSLPESLTQIELRITAALRKNPCYCLPPNMRGIINQSPGHIELWFFGWTTSYYRKNLNIYPLPAALFIPYLVCTAQKEKSAHLQIDIRPERELSFLRSLSCERLQEVPFFSIHEYAALIRRGFDFHPSQDEYKEMYEALQLTIDSNII